MQINKQHKMTANLNYTYTDISTLTNELLPAFLNKYEILKNSILHSIFTYNIIGSISSSRIIYNNVDSKNFLKNFYLSLSL